jgi:hypothetical protein
MDAAERAVPVEAAQHPLSPGIVGPFEAVKQGFEIAVAVHGDAQHFPLHPPIEALDDAVIRYEICGACRLGLCSLKDGIMVSPSGTRGTGSTKVRAGRQQTLG